MKKIIFLLLIVAFWGGFFTHRQLSGPEPKGDQSAVLDRDYYGEALSLIQNSEKSIDVLMFELFFYPEYPQSKPNLLLTALVDARRRGVMVRVCVEGGEEYLGEDFSMKQRNGYDYLLENGVQIRLDPKGVTSHAKLLIVDGKNLLLGSTNWSYHALERNRETNISVESARLSSHYQKYFDELWRSSSPLSTDEKGKDQFIARILTDPAAWDGKRVRISGELEGLKKTRSRSGNLYSTFYIVDAEGNRMKGFRWGHLDMADGEEVEAEGVFRREKRVGKFTFYNELEANTIVRR